MSNQPPGCCGYLQICSENCGFYEQVERRHARAAATPTTEYLPGDPQPTGPVPPEPEGAFSNEMHTRNRIDSNWVKCSDGIERPAHYANYPIDPVTFAMINELPAWKFQVVKYTCRAGLKGSEEDDIRKAIRHLEMRLELLKRQREGSLSHVVGRPL